MKALYKSGCVRIKVIYFKNGRSVILTYKMKKKKEIEIFSFHASFKLGINYHNALQVEKMYSSS